MAFKINNSDSFEGLTIVISKEKYPILFENKVRELIKNGLTREQAEESVQNMEVDLELYYEEDGGFFAVEQEAISSQLTIYSPYTAEEGKYPNEL